ncbi:MAG: hypothetical protein D6696_21655 [Acidobacteria bacterium]|nr:MAG: hypothetical protein D6696_21655 [Acidobacteriota bacterium]
MTLLNPALYKGREQTYVKHLVLEGYLRKLAYKWGYYGGTINYVDCFAGPWRHKSEDLEAGKRVPQPDKGHRVVWLGGDQKDREF